MTKTITPEFLQILRADMNQALAFVAQKHGISLQVGRASYTAKEATFKLVAMAEEGKTIQDVKQEKMGDALSVARLMYKDIDFDAIYKDIRGKRFKITGYNRRAPKHCFLITDQADGKVYTANQNHFKAVGGSLVKVV